MITLRNKKTLITLLIAMFLIFPLVSAGDWGISKDWVLADPNATLIPAPTPTPTSKPGNTTLVDYQTQNNNDTLAVVTPNPTVEPNNQPTPTNTEINNATNKPSSETYNPPSLIFIVLFVIVILGSIAGTFLVIKLKQKGAEE